MEIDLEFKPNENLPEIPEVSLLFELPKDFEQVTYLGAGPEENYIDRKCAFRYYNMRVFAFICPCLDDWFV